MRQGYIAGAVLAVGIAVTPAACAVSTPQEVEMGRSYAAEIARQLPLIDDPAIARYLTRLGDSIARLVDERGLRWEFHLVNSKDINAFAVPGGFIYVNRGLVERAEKMSQLAGVLGHEIGHVTMRHSVEQMQKARGTNIAVTIGCAILRACSSGAEQVLINAGAGLAFARFSRDAEREADREGVKYVVRAGIDPNGIPEMFEMLLNERKSRPAGVETWFLSHPLEEERVARAREMIRGYDPAVLRSLNSDAAGYAQFRSRVTALPLPPAARRSAAP
jgi:predicted Zn-dependent protease